MTRIERGGFMLTYETLSTEISKQIEADQAALSLRPFAFDNQKIIRRRAIPKDHATIWRPAFVQDIDKILHCPYYNRYADKTQVFSLVKNDDISHRSLHVQLVSRIARTIGAALNLNLDLIEAISLGHDIGHTPFGHTGESYLDELYFQNTGRHFLHAIHSVRVLDKIFPLNLSLQTLDGILCHNGEIELEEYHPYNLSGFDEFDERLERCYIDPAFSMKLMPATLEGCVVRLSDIIAYLGKDRQDAARVKQVEETAFSHTVIGSFNAEIINNLMVNIIEHSYGKPYIKLDSAHFEALQTAKRENYAKIYENSTTRTQLDTNVKPMMKEIYYQLLDDLEHHRKDSPIFTHHIDYVNHIHYTHPFPYEKTEANQIVVDYIASMTDDYLIDLHHYLFPNSEYQVNYLGYFDS